MKCASLGEFLLVWLQGVLILGHSPRIHSGTRHTLSEQHTLFRINCVDCLDRTNVVQAAIAKAVLEMMVNFVVLSDGNDRKFSFDVSIICS